MSTTALTVVNNVIKRLRENQVNSTNFLTDAYGQLILQFVNETKREVENAWDWTILRQSLTVTTAVGTSTYSVTGAGDRFRFYDPRQIIINATNRTTINQSNAGWFEEMKLTSSTNNAQPCWYRFVGQDTSGDPIVELYPAPDGIYSLRFPFVVPETDLTVYTSTFKVNGLAVELGAWARAISERGEDGGQNTSEQWNMYKNYVGDLIAIDAGRVSDEVIWQTV